ncbi:MAG: 2-dehydro-3-deoxygalactonokinase [Thalassobaculales bacterium]
MTACLIALDWGTTNLRAYLVGGGGAILDRRASAEGILNVPPGGFPDAFARAIAGWPGLPALMAGMVGARQGWVEVPYLEVPAGLPALAAALHPAPGGVARIVPGLCRRADPPDVMRGEEVQVLGIGGDGAFCLPGTHSKWVMVEGGRIVDLASHMTGEVFDVLRRHSILGRMMVDGHDEAAFAAGVARSGQPGGLLNHIFGARAGVLLEVLPAAGAASFLSGVLIGHELRAAPALPITLVGAGPLCDLYERALALLGRGCRRAGEEASVAGLWKIWEVLR